jgi:hypothetical protein
MLDHTDRENADFLKDRAAIALVRIQHRPVRQAFKERR